MASSIFLQRGCTGSLRGLSNHARLCASNPMRLGNTIQISRLGLLPALTTSSRAQTTQVFRCTSPGTPQISNPPTPSVLQFVSNKIWQATHRSRIPQRSSRSPFTPPPRPRGLWQQIKDRIDSLPSNGIFWGIMALNGIVFGLWQYARANWEVGRDPSAMIWLRRNFNVSMQNIREGRLWCLLTACFSHQDFSHILMNGFTFYFMAPHVLAMLGNTSFLALYIGGGIFASAASLLWNNRVKGHTTYASHGASGAIYGVLSFFACVLPRVQFALFGVIPMPAWVFVTGVFLWDGYGSLNNPNQQGGTDTAGHVAGILGGIGYFLVRRFRIF